MISKIPSPATNGNEIELYIDVQLEDSRDNPGALFAPIKRYSSELFLPTRETRSTPVSTEQNKQTVLAFLEQALHRKQPAEAAEVYLGSHYMQHNPQVADGAEAFVGFVTGFTQQFPDLHLDIKRVIAEGDLVVTHGLLTVAPGDRGTAVMDIFRLDNGKIVEHWDVLQPVPEEAANANSMV